MSRRVRFVGTPLALALLALILSAIVPEAAAQQEVIVRLRTDAPAEVRATLDGTAGKRAREALRDVEAVERPHAGHSSFLRDVFVLRVSEGADPEGVRRRWAARAGVAYAQRNHVYTVERLAAGDDPLLDSLDHLHVIRAPEAWTLSRGAGAVIGFVDTGLYPDHPDLAAQRWLNKGEDADGDGRITEADFDGIDGDGNGYVDDVYGYDFVDRPLVVEPGDYHGRDPRPDEYPDGGHGHGTIVAGVLAAAAGNGTGGAGVAPAGRLMTLRAFGEDGRGEDDDISAAIVYAADQGADVLNLSFGDTYYSPLMHDAIRYAVERGVVVVASAGNVGGDDPHYPSDYPEVVSTAWLGADGLDIAWRGTHGVGPDLGAPGSAVFTTRLPVPSGVDREVALYGRYSGSSLAAPMVAGAAALVRAVDRTLSPASLRSILTATAADIRATGWDHYTGAGRLDAAGAVRRALPARTALDHPDEGGGVNAARVPVIGSAVDPAFESYRVWVAPGAEAPFDWRPLTDAVPRQAARDTLAWWRASDAPEGLYTLRLVTTLRGGRTVEDRRRVTVDRSPPMLDVRLLAGGLVDGRPGPVAEVVTDDRTRVWIEAGDGPRVASDRLARHHGLAVQVEEGRGLTVRVRLVAENTVGMRAEVVRPVRLPAGEARPAWLRLRDGTLPYGYLLPQTTDFDGDGLAEVTTNPFVGGGIVDTLVTYEWAGDGFRRAHALATPLQSVGENAFAPVGAVPRDTGDTDGDGLAELLGSSDFGSVLFEQPTPDAFPARIAFREDTSRTLFGARLVDLTGDRRDELLAHDGRAWSVYRRDGDALTRLAVLDNPTDSTGGEAPGNRLQQPRILAHDLDGDGATELLAGDSDGDLVLYRWVDGTARALWSHETDRYAAGARMAYGDFDGDGRTEVVTRVENWKGARGDGEHEPPVALYTLWRARPDGLVPLDSLPVTAGDLSTHDVLRAVDFERDGRPELVLVHPPHLFVLTVDQGRFVLLDQLGAGGGGVGFRSIQAVDADFDGDGVREVLVGRTDGTLVRLAPDAAAGVAVPAWVRARALDAGTVDLAWRAPGTDSVTVFASAAGGTFDPRLNATVDTARLAETDVRRYALAAWLDGRRSPLSEARLVRPHAPARVTAVEVVPPDAVRLHFTEPLAPTTRAASFTLAPMGAARSVLLLAGGTRAQVAFGALPPGAHALALTGLSDAEGTPAADTTLVLTVPAREPRELLVTAWRILSADEVELTFDAPLDAEAARDTSRYGVRPGHVAAVRFDASAPERVAVVLEGPALGATGRPVTLRVRSMRGAGGERLAAEGAALRLSQPAPSLAEAYVFPNPLDAGRHGERLMVAGLPPEADVQILAADGSLVRRLEERDADGGVPWDLRAADGTRVPSGVYLVRIEADGEAPVLKKAAVIR